MVDIPRNADIHLCVVWRQVVNVCIGTFAFCTMYLLYVLTLDSFYLCGAPPHPSPPGGTAHMAYDGPTRHACGTSSTRRSPPQCPVHRVPVRRYAEFGGFHGVIAALLVAVRQLSPEEPLIDYGPSRLRLRAKVCARARLSAALPCQPVHTACCSLRSLRCTALALPSLCSALYALRWAILVFWALLSRLLFFSSFVFFDFSPTPTAPSAWHHP